MPLLKQARSFRLKQTNSMRPLKYGGAFDFFKVLKDIGGFIQKGIDTIAPITSKLAGPIASSLSGVSIPNFADASPATLMPAAKQILDKNEGKLPVGIEGLLRSALDKGSAKIGSGYKSKALMSGKGLSFHS